MNILQLLMHILVIIIDIFRKLFITGAIWRGYKKSLSAWLVSVTIIVFASSILITVRLLKAGCGL